MRIETFDTLPHGLYRIYWGTGGSSLCSIGSRADGKIWIACTNWIRPAFTDEEVLNMVDDIAVYEEVNVPKKRNNDTKFQILSDWRNHFSPDEFELFRVQLNMLMDALEE